MDAIANTPGLRASGSDLRWGTSPEALDPAIRDALARVRLVAFDFDGVMTDNRVYVDETGREAVACSRFEGLGLDRLRACGIGLCIISTEVNSVVARRAEKLKLPVEHGVGDKVAALRHFADMHAVDLADCAFVGNDINDRPALQAAGIPIVVGDCHPSVAHLGLYRTERPGGHGAVREICDLIADIHEAS